MIVLDYENLFRIPANLIEERGQAKVISRHSSGPEEDTFLTVDAQNEADLDEIEEIEIDSELPSG